MRRVVVLSLTALALLLPELALADATPTQVVLLYMPNVSTTGTTTASGIAELVLPEGEVRISATDLPRLDGSAQYVAWVVDTDTNDFLRLGAFNTAQTTGAVHFEQVLPDPIDTKQHWNLVLLTVEDSATPDHPGTRHSIAGMFPPSGADLVPELLPNTGGLPDEAYPVVGRQSSVAGQSNWLPNMGLVALGLAITGVAGYALGRRSARPSR
jgi:hypothetical protein